MDVVGKLVMAVMHDQRPTVDEVIQEFAPSCWLDLWKLAQRCWHADAAERPLIFEVLTTLDSID